jgi:carbon starvation protein
MNILWILLAAVGCYLVASRFYGRYLERTLGVDPMRPTAAHTKKDGRDFIPTKPYVLFAHHFAAIAGAGPIVGPTLAMAYGYLPALLWVVFGAIFLGGAHDMATLYVSVREEGKSIADIARASLGNSGYILIVSFLVITLFLITATFLNLSVTALTSIYPAEKVGLKPVPASVLQEAMRSASRDRVDLVPFASGAAMPTAIALRDGQPVLMARVGGIASTSVLFITLCAPLLGVMIYKLHSPTWLNYTVAAGLCLTSVALGLYHPVVVTPDTWRILMTVYVLLASAIPVWLLLMPRDFVNVQILYGGLLAVVVALVMAAIGGEVSEIAVAPQSAAETIPAWDATEGMKYIGMLWPMLFITVSCGAISGFHCLVSSGTSAKQLANERDTLSVGYNAMLLESLLAVAVILTLLLGLDWEAYRNITYGEKIRS